MPSIALARIGSRPGLFTLPGVRAPALGAFHWDRDPVERIELDRFGGEPGRHFPARCRAADHDIWHDGMYCAPGYPS
jgi:hypothetical protein